MQFDLTTDDVRKWTGFSDLIVPSSATLTCPQCFTIGAFTLTGHTNLAEGHVFCTGHCPACPAKIAMWIIGPEPARSGARKVLGIKCWPAPATQRAPAFDLKFLSESIKSEYLDSLRSFNAQHWKQTVVMCRRTLEAVVIGMLGSTKPGVPLAHRLQELKGQVDLKKPIEQMAGVVKDGGNLGAHFQLEREATQQIAEATLTMLEAFLEYLYVIPKQVTEAQAMIDPPTIAGP